MRLEIRVFNPEAEIMPNKTIEAPPITGAGIVKVKLPKMVKKPRTVAKIAARKRLKGS
jgi:hypothetical protein